MPRRKWICTALILALCMQFLPGAVFAAQNPQDPAKIEAEGELPLPEETAPMVNEEAVLPDAVASIPEETTEPTEEAVVPAPEAPKGWGLYFGQLHGHSDISDGTAPVAHLYGQAAAAGLDFFAVTDNGESISGAPGATLGEDMTGSSADWAAGKAAAAEATDRDFVGIYGFEMAWPGEKRIGHISTFGTPGFVSWQQPAYAEPVVGLEAYGKALASVPGSVSQFCHPGIQTGDFQGFTQYSAQVDRAVQLLEVGTGQWPYKYYTQALDYGWHVAPSCNQTNHYDRWENFSLGRTVILANTLTEAGLYEAIANYRVYATRDSDLHIYFDQMGCRLQRHSTGPELTLMARLYDPTDGIGTVEVITTGGEAVASETIEENSGEVALTLPTNSPYYYLKITQADGDTAVTAPVWLEGEPQVGIASFTCETELPTQGRPVTLGMTLVNGNPSALMVEKVEFSLDEEVFHSMEEITVVLAGEQMAYSCGPTLYCLGTKQLRVTVTASMDGTRRVYEKTLSLSFHRDNMVTDILVDAAHGNAGTDRLQPLAALAAENRVGLTVVREKITREMLADAGILLVTAPEKELSEEFVENAAEFVRHGGTLILCGRSAGLDGAVSSAEQLNRLLTAVGSTMTVRSDSVLDPVHNVGKPELLYPTTFHTGQVWLEGLKGDSLYRHDTGCTIDPGKGSWLVKGWDTTSSELVSARPVLLAWEECGEGKLFAGGSLWLGEEELAPAKNIWDLPLANRTVAEAILGVAAPEVERIEIAALKQAAEGETYTIRGYVTAGTARQGNQFPGMIYLQDDTGGIGVAPFDQEGISRGTALEITGYLEKAGRNHVFHPVTVTRLDSRPYLFPGITGSYDQLMNNSINGGRLVEIQGIVQRLQVTEEGILSQIILRDGKNRYATVLIEPYIVSGATGKNELALDIRQGQEVRALGILHMAEDGTAVIRVRNCDEVVVIDPWPYTPDQPRKVRDKTNPNSGDRIVLWLGLEGLSAGILAWLWRKKYCEMGRPGV